MSWVNELFNPITASTNLWNLYFAFYFKYLKERDPNDPLPSQKRIKNIFLKENPYWEDYEWLVFSDTSKSKIIGSGNLSCTSEESPAYEKNKRSARIQVVIDSEYRRKGIGSNLFQMLIEEAEKIGKTTFVSAAASDSGREFCKKFGGKIITESKESRLYLEKVDWKAIDRWRTEGANRNPKVTIEQFEEIPNKDFEEFCALCTEVSNLEPSEDEYQVVITPESRRKEEQLYRELGLTQITMITQEPNGKMSGLTEVSTAEKDQPECVYQGLTGVKKEYQGRGLGKWLKAEMLDYIKERFPKATYVMTENTIVNAPMLSINERLGSKLYKKTTEYKFLIKELQKKLSNY